jgi:hypothetical protein
LGLGDVTVQTWTTVEDVEEDVSDDVNDDEDVNDNEDVNDEDVSDEDVDEETVFTSLSEKFLPPQTGARRTVGGKIC